MTYLDIRAALSEEQSFLVTMWAEARSEPLVGKLAVGCVVRNRVVADLNSDSLPDWWGEGYKGVCLAPWQFSCWWEKAPNTTRTYDLALSLVENRSVGAGNDVILAELAWIYDGLTSFALRDITSGSTHYVTKQMLTVKPPKWAVGRQPVAQFGNHVFFNNVP